MTPNLPPTTRRSLALAAALLAGLSLGLGCAPDEDGKTGERGPRGGRDGGGPPAPTVAVAPVVTEAVARTLVAVTTLEPEAQIELLARTDGEALEVEVEVGDPVQNGQVLLRQDGTRAELALRQAQLALVQAQTAAARSQELRERGILSDSDLELARQEVARAELALESAELDVRDTVLLSPRAGVVTERLVAKGAAVRTGDVVLRLADPTPLLARLRIPEAQAEALRPGQLAWIEFEGGERPLPLFNFFPWSAGAPGPLLGVVRRVAPSVDAQSGTVEATVEVVGGARRVRMFRFATVRVVVEVRPQALTIPQSALALRGDSERVLVFVPDQGGQGRVEERVVRVGVRTGQRVEIVSGLEVGERVGGRPQTRPERIP